MIEAYFMLSGRMRRRAYLGYSLLLWPILLLLVLLGPSVLQNAHHPAAATLCLAFVVGLFWVWAGIALAVKRLHDLNRPGWHYLWMFLLPGSIAGITGSSHFEAESGGISLSWSGGTVFSLAVIWLLLGLVYLLFAQGSDGPNRFGYPP